MRVLLINPAFNRYGGIAGHGGAMMPLNLCYLAAYGRVQYPDVEFRIMDAELWRLTHEEAVREAKDSAPHLIGITANTCAFDSVIALVTLLKEQLPEVCVVLGGPHPSALPERTLREAQADLAVIGEGELTFAEIVGQIKAGTSKWDGIPGVAYRDKNHRICVNAPRPFVEDLDSLPLPARDLVDNASYAPPPTKRVSLGPATLIATSRGCTHDCGFCGAKTVWHRRLRTRSALSVVDEMEECISRYGIRTFSFTDEFFTAKRSRVEEMCRAIRERNLEVRWVCMARAQALDLDLLRTMKDAGCHEISFGIESGAPEILERMHKSIDLDEVRGVIARTRKAGITTHASYMFGYIGETEDTIRQTLRFAKKLNTTIAAFFIASPLPGTPLYAEAVEKGYLRGDATWADYAPLSNREPVLNLPGLSSATIRKWHRKALRAYYVRPRYILSRLLGIRHGYEIANLLGGVRLLFRIK